MIRHRRLDNGLTLLTEEMPDLRSVAMGVWLRRGSRHEHPDANGISHFIEHLVFKGTEKRSSIDIAREIDSVGGQMDAFTGKEHTCFYFRVLDQHLDLAMDLLTDIVLHPRFSEDDIEKERRVVFEEIRMVDDSPEELLFDLLYEARYADHMLGRPVQGTFDTVRLIDAGMLRAFFRHSYVASNLVLAVAGRIDAARIEEDISRAFSPLPAGDSPLVDPVPREHGSIVLREKKELEQLHLCLGVGGYPQAHEDRYALMVLSNLLGGTMSSRLFQKVREQRGLAYSVSAGVNAHADCGFQSIYAATSPGSAREVLQIIAEELRDLKEKPVSEREIADSRENLKGGLMLNLESTYSRMANLARKEIAFGHQFTLEEILAGIDRVSAQDVRRVARETFDPAKATFAALGPLNGFGLDHSDLDF